jgi:hypothetical protein
MKGFTDEMAEGGKHLDDKEIICYILAGLNFELNPFIEVFMAKTISNLEWSLFSATHH